MNQVFCFKAHINQLEEIQNLILSFAKQSSDSTRKDIKLAIEEVVVNIINYAYLDDCGRIEVECAVLSKSNELMIRFKDYGIPFNPLDYSIKPTLETVGGLGIQIFRQLMNKVTYSRSLGSNTLTLIKSLNL